jgi:hypothetical protein
MIMTGSENRIISSPYGGTGRIYARTGEILQKIQKHS